MKNIPKKTLFGVTLASIVLLPMVGCDRMPRTDTPSNTANPTPPVTQNSSDTSVGTSLDDSVITTKVKSAFLADDNVKGLDIGVDTRKGEVYLSGLIDDKTQLERAVQIASNIEGVKNVVNKMSVKK